MPADEAPTPGIAVAVTLERAGAILRQSKARLECSQRSLSSGNDALRRSFDTLIGQRPARSERNGLRP